MATGHIVDEVEKPLEDVTKECFVYEDDAEINEESDNNGDDDETTTHGIREWDGESSSASSIRKVYTERQTSSKRSLLQTL